MERTKLSSKGQVVLPKLVRDMLGWTQGMEFVVEASADGVLLRPISCFRTTTVREVLGCARYTGERRSARDFENAIRKGMLTRRADRRHNGRR